MGASLYWRPAEAGKYICGGGILLRQLEELFGVAPISLNEGDLVALRALALGLGQDSDAKGVKEIIDAIEKHQSVIVEARY